MLSEKYEQTFPLCTWLLIFLSHLLETFGLFKDCLVFIPLSVELQGCRAVWSQVCQRQEIHASHCSQPLFLIGYVWIWVRDPLWILWIWVRDPLI